LDMVPTRDFMVV